MLKLIKKSAGIIIKDKKLLVERSKGKEFFISPGVTIEKNETPIETLIRELFEEFKITITDDDIEYFDTFSAPAAGLENTIVEIFVYRVNSYKNEITPDSEVEEIAWVNSKNMHNYKLGSIFEHKVLPKLILTGHIE